MVIMLDFGFFKYRVTRLIFDIARKIELKKKYYMLNNV